MEFRDALKLLRRELGITQMELANALNVNYSTVSRWELGKTLPNRSITSALMEYAQNNSASKKCIYGLKQAILNAAKTKLDLTGSGLYAVEHASLRQLIDDASFPLYVCDMETYELLYINHQAEKMIGGDLEQINSSTCYQCIMHADAPCEFCHKNELVENHFIGYDAFRPSDGTIYRVQGKLIRWNGRRAQVRYVTQIGQSVNMAVQLEREQEYKKQLQLKRQLSLDAIAFAHYNLTKNTVLDAESDRDDLKEIMSSGSVDDVLKAIGENTFDAEEQCKFDFIRDRSAMIRLFYSGKTHVSVKHHLKNDKQFYESTFDFLQNPATYEIEVVAILHDITEAALKEEAFNTLLSIDYETILTIDAETGEIQPFGQGRLETVIAQQEKSEDNVSGVTEYLRKYCADIDVEWVVRENSLPYIKELLKSKQIHTVMYSLRQNGKILHKKVLYTYLDNSQTTILCAVQDLTEIYRQIENQLTTD